MNAKWKTWVMKPLFLILAFACLILVLTQVAKLLEPKYIWESIAVQRDFYGSLEGYEEAEGVTLSFVGENRFKAAIGYEEFLLTNNTDTPIACYCNADDWRFCDALIVKTENGEKLRCVIEKELEPYVSTAIGYEPPEIPPHTTVQLSLPMNGRIHPEATTFPAFMQEPGEYELLLPLSGTKTYVTAPFTIVD